MVRLFWASSRPTRPLISQEVTLSQGGFSLALFEFFDFDAVGFGDFFNDAIHCLDYAVILGDFLYSHDGDLVGQSSTGCSAGYDGCVV